jgi:hypothetical protein
MACSLRAKYYFIIIAAALGVTLGVTGPVEGAERRVALVIGNSAYQSTAALLNPRNDAKAVGDALKRLGFEVEVAIDLSKVALDQAVRRFGDRLEGASVALFYYAGHGLEVNGVNYLVPIDATLDKERDVYYQAMDVNLVMREMEAETRVNMVFLDACRNNPLARKLRASGRGIAVGRGLAPIDASAGTLISYATKGGDIAEDGDGRNSPYTTALLKHIETPGIDVSIMLRRVREDVIKATQKRQVPWEYGALMGEFYFKVAQPLPPPTPPEPVRPAPPSTSEAEVVYYRAIQDSTDPADFRAFLAVFPKGVFADLAQRKLARLTQTKPAPTQPQSRPPEEPSVVKRDRPTPPNDPPVVPTTPAPSRQPLFIPPTPF